MFYLSPGSWGETQFYPNLPNNTYPACTVPDKNIGYDPRCRPWYSTQIENKDYSIVHDPYQSFDGKVTYFTLSTYTDIAQMDSVVAVDLNLNNEWF